MIHHYPLPSLESTPNPFGELSHPAITALATSAIGPSLADQLLGESLLKSRSSQEKAIQVAMQNLANFADRLYPGQDSDSNEERQAFIDGWKVDYDQESNQAVIYKLKHSGSSEIDNNYGLDISGRGLSGELLLPKELKIAILDCSGNQLTSLPELPESLTALSCWDNQLTSLPELPESLTALSCDNNQLTSLPELPESLTELYCRGNQLTSLPELPESLTALYCWGNQLTSLPELPESLTWLHCENNQLTSLPELPESLTWLSCDTNPMPSGYITELKRKRPKLRIA